MNKVRITVLKTLFDEELSKDNFKLESTEIKSVIDYTPVE
mgnify:FL=1|jgi:hypothetical protein